MSSRVFIFFFAIACTFAEGAEPAKPFVLLNQKYFQRGIDKNYFVALPKGSAPKTGKWKGLFCQGLDCEIADAKVEIVPGKMKVCDGPETVPAEIVTVSGNPVAIFNGIDLNNRKVTTRFRANLPSNNKQSKLDIVSGEEVLTLSWVRFPPSNSELGFPYQYRFHIQNSSTKQFIFSIEGGDTPEVIPFIPWAGDLDGDGKTDILVKLLYDHSDQACYYCRFAERVYLSSQVKNGEILHKAGETAGEKPACGC